MKVIQLKAYEVMGSPDYYNCIVTFGNSKVEWECQNYSRHGNTIRFGRIVAHGYDPDGKWLIQVINKYVDPEAICNVQIEEEGEK